MFTGIIEEVGTVVSIDHHPEVVHQPEIGHRPEADGPGTARLRLAASTVVTDAVPGGSIAVDGVCLTVVDHDAEGFTADVMGETLAVSALGDRKPGDRVNLERAVRADGRLAGHIVQGHVDAVGTIVSRTPADRWEVVRVAVPAEVRPLIVHKGSIAIDGISLTVSAITEDGFEVSLIPTTLADTTLGAAAVGTRVNLETDVLAKYVAAQLAAHKELATHKEEA